MNKKRVLIFVPEFPRLSETFIARDISKLIQLDKLDIKVFSLAKGSGTSDEWVRERTFYHRISIADLIKGLFKFGFLHPYNAVKTLFLMMEHRNSSNSYDKQSTILSHYLKSFGYAHLMSGYNPDEIHVHFFSDSSNIGMAAAMFLQIPFSINAHAKDVLVNPSLAQLKVKEAKFVTVCNKNAYQKLVELAGGNSQNIHLVYHGIDPQKIFEVSDKDVTNFNSLVPVKPTRPVIFLGGTRLVEKKGIKYMLEASKILKDIGVDHEVHIIGPKDPLDPVDRLEELSNLSQKLGVSDNVLFYGAGKGLPFKLVSQFYKVADVFVLPSINAGSGDADGIPNTLIEAAFACVPIVTTDAGSITELITDGKEGIVVPQKDPQAIANAIVEILNSRTLSQKLVQNAYNKAQEMFNSDKNVSNLMQLLIE